ncbi:hypothetical protein E2P81_ATG07604 [Venturia nashicola]|nr:hypothetical protein E2P81_ATG07604 [Venturia nashicola]
MGITNSSAMSTIEFQTLTTILSSHTSNKQREVFLLNKIQPTAEVLHQITYDFLIGQTSYSIYRRCLLTLKPKLEPLVLALQENDRIGRRNSVGSVASMRPLIFPHFDIDGQVRWRLERVLRIGEEVKISMEQDKYARAMAVGLEEDLGWFLDNGKEKGIIERLEALSLG